MWKGFRKEFNEDENYHVVLNHCNHPRKYRCLAHSICDLGYKIPKEIPVVFHNGPNYDYHFIIRELDNLKKTHRKS